MKEIRKRGNFAFQEKTENPTASMMNLAHNFNLDIKLYGLGTGAFKKKRKSVFGSSLTEKATEHQVSALLKAMQAIFLLPSRGTPSIWVKLLVCTDI